MAFSGLSGGDSYRAVIPANIKPISETLPGRTIGSVANYLKSYGWEAEQAIAVPALVNSEIYQEALFSGNWPSYTVADLKTLGIAPRASVPGNSYASLIELKNNGGNEYWLEFNNFYVITLYNRNVNYAMSVLLEASYGYCAIPTPPPSIPTFRDQAFRMGILPPDGLAMSI